MLTAFYVISVLGHPAGAAKLTVDREHQTFTFDASLSVSSAPCLTSEEHTHGSTALDQEALPEEAFVARALELGRGCRDLSALLPRPLGVFGDRLTYGRGCWDDVSRGIAHGRILFNHVTVKFAEDGLPAAVEYPELGVIYRRSDQKLSIEPTCRRGFADEGVLAPGSDWVDARGLRYAVYATEPSGTSVKTDQLAVPPKVLELVRKRHNGEIKTCQETAHDLVADLRAAGFRATPVAGLLLDHGRYYPHAWVEVDLGNGRLVAVDATTGEGEADAGHVRAGPLGDMATGLTLLRWLNAPPRISCAGVTSCGM